MENIRFAWRMFLKSPVLTAIAALTLALGIGANTAIFSVVDAVLLRPLPYRNPGQLISLSNTFREKPLGVSVIELADYREQAAPVLDQLAAILVFDANLTGGDQPERVQGAGVSANYFEILGVAPQLGRTFTSDEQRVAWTEIAVISDSLWKRRFGGSPEVLGKKIRIDDDPWVIIGVMPPGFRHPAGQAVVGEVDFWSPCGFAAEPFPEPKRQFRFLDAAMGRLKPGVDLPTARAAIATVAERLKAQYPDAYGTEVASWGVKLRPLEEQVVGGARPGLIVLLGAVLLVLLIACTNVANLLLARASVRGQELAIRKALGATGRQLVGQLLTESVFLALVGGGLGLIIAYWGIDLLQAFAPAGLPRAHEIHLDLRVLAFTFGVSVACGLLFGVIPALQGSRVEPQAALKEGTISVGARRHRLLGALVVGEFALALVVLGSAGLLLRSLWNATEVKPGFDASGVLTARLWLPQPNKLEAGKYNKPEQRDVFYRGLLQRLGSSPAVEAAALITTVPLRGDPARTQFGILPEGKATGDKVQIVQGRTVSPDYFRLMRVPMVSGRAFAHTDEPKSPRVAIVNQTLARHFWPGEEAVGKRFKFPPGSGPPGEPWFTVVGVVADVKTTGLDSPTPDEVYTASTQAMGLSTGVVLRAHEGSPAALAPVLRAKLAEMDPELPIFEVMTMEDVLGQAMAERRFTALLLALFAAVALALAALGIYGVMAYAVSQRQKEIAVRMALGAKQKDVLRMVIGQGLRLVGLAVGVGGAVLFGGTRLIASLLFGVSPTDGVTFGAIAGGLVAVALLASWLPARRAARTSPMTALRRD